MDATTENGGSDRRPRPNRDDRLHDQRLQREGRRMPILSTTRRRTMPPGTVMGFPVIGGTAANNADATSKRIKAGDISASSASPDESSERHPCPAQASKIHAQGAYEKSIGINPFSNKIAAMNKDNRISPELQTKIDALPDENRRENILRFLNRLWARKKSNEQIFDEMLADYENEGRSLEADVPLPAPAARPSPITQTEPTGSIWAWIWREFISTNFDAPYSAPIQREISTQDERTTLAISKQEILSFLHAIESGEIVLTPLREPQWVYAGVVGHEASNGWRVAAFNDANEWDYIECVIASDGRRVDYYDIQDEDSDLEHYAPSNDVAWRCYGIPGYRRNRCKQCSSSIDADPSGRYLCQQCIS